ncbi:hypothetical protein QR680_012973 [Steinernema hermaphroditum]|uniref:Copper homeostasis protein cutC homolog n=1 Tax=Steinernema hermaphroditum TaxID=289476 RepID=A0AA39M0T6_9BILA|nr:hypothetical protein QR680_012973 [Steinernema hermaphroditum]
MVLLEICIDSFESAKAAAEGGADRLEVCSSLTLGGLTPSTGLLKHIKSVFPGLPAYCMLRAREGDFVYSAQEIETSLQDCEELRRCGADGFVFGALRPDGSLDQEACKTVIDACAPLPVTLHRAFDYARDWETCLQAAMRLGFRAVLSSGHRATAVEGVEVLRRMVESFPEITIIAGSGVQPGNVDQLLRAIPSIGGIHGSASRTVPSRFKFCPRDFRMGPADDGSTRKATDSRIVAELAARIRR